jgi:acetyl/propionyl-CoA carboxylase alpha subunit
VEVNGNAYDIEIARNAAKINGMAIDLETLNEAEVIIDGEKFFLDFVEEGEPSLMIINGMSYLVSRSSSEGLSVGELRAPINGQITGVFVKAGSKVIKGQLLVTLEAMKMENQMKSPLKGSIKEVNVKNGQSVKKGEILMVFE